MSKSKPEPGRSAATPASQAGASASSLGGPAATQPGSTSQPTTQTSTGSSGRTTAAQPRATTTPEATPKSARERKEENKAHDPLRGSRSSGFYASVVALAVVLVLLIIFILQNTQTAQVNFLGWSGSAPASVVLLIAAAAGLFLALIASSLRIFQLRRRVKKARKSS